MWKNNTRQENTLWLLFCIHVRSNERKFKLEPFGFGGVKRGDALSPEEVSLYLQTRDSQESV